MPTERKHGDQPEPRRPRHLARWLFFVAFGLALSGSWSSDFVSGPTVWLRTFCAQLFWTKTVWAQTVSDEKPTTEGAAEDDAKGAGSSESEPPAPVDNAPPTKGFKPSEKIGADSVVAFPVDI
jgi:hypothetical protein